MCTLFQLIETVSAQQPSKCAFKVTFAKVIEDKPVKEPITGRLFVFLSQRRGEPRFGPNWFSPEPFFAKDVVGFRPGTSILLDDTADSFPQELNALKPGTYNVQALLDHDFYLSTPGAGVGNFYSQVQQVEIDPDENETIEVKLTEIVMAREFKETDWLKKVQIESKLLSAFHKRPVFQDAAVVLPKSYFSDPKRRFPVFYEVSGFGGTLDRMTRRYRSQPPESEEEDVPLIRVFLTGQCKWGHHVYANSAINGPRGDALVAELIPEIDKRFRTIQDLRARFVGGHSSGGWSSLWLQINYPETFGGVWSTSPDPVDFRDFQQTNLYADPPQSLYFDTKGERRPLARVGKRVMLWYPNFARMDDTIGRGGQLRSFEAVFSPLGEDGQPLRLWDRKTGEIDVDVAKAWKNYDINLILANNWSELKDRLEGKIHISMGDKDTFYLEGATILLKETLRKLGSDAEVNIIEGADHMNILNSRLRRQRQDQINETFLKSFQLNGKAKS